MPHCAFLTIANTAGWFIDDDLVYEPLQNLGWQVTPVVWNSEVDWNRFDVVVIRSPWDYQQHLAHFLSVLQRIHDSSALLLNSLRTVQWNIDKRYLFDLQRQGIEIVPTLCIDSPRISNIDQARQHFHTEQLVIKSSIGANADDTFRITELTSEMELANICQRLAGRTCFIQPMMSGIITEGEFSLQYFNGVFSHAIIKTVQPGDFRVQEEHGGGVIPLPQPPAELLATANSVLATLEELPLYARVDLVRTNANTFALMELELIEPCLYFRFAENSAAAFATAIVNRYLQSS